MFLLIQETGRSMTNFLTKLLWLCQTSIDILETISTITLIPEVDLETSGTSRIKFFCDFF